MNKPKQVLIVGPSKPWSPCTCCPQCSAHIAQLEAQLAEARERHESKETALQTGIKALREQRDALRQRVEGLEEVLRQIGHSDRTRFVDTAGQLAWCVQIALAALPTGDQFPDAGKLIGTDGRGDWTDKAAWTAKGKE